MENENKIDLIVWLQRSLDVVSKTWKVLLVSLLLFTVLNVVHEVINYQPLYESKLTFSVLKEKNGQSSFSYNKEATDQLSASFLTIIQSNLMVEAICEHMNVSSIPATFRIERIESTNLFSVYAQSSNPQDAKDVLDALSHHYKQISKVALNDASLNVIESPELATQPTNSVNYPRTIGRGIVFGLAVYAVYALCYALLRRTIHRPQEIKTVLHSRCLCSLLKIKVLSGKRVLLSDPLSHADHLKDAFHRVRMEMENARKEYQQKIFMVTSAMAHEGKSTVTSNLALLLAQHGYKVLLADLDLRNPTQRFTFSLSTEGKTVKLGGNTFCFCEGVEEETLDLFTTLDAQANASEILSDPEIGKWLEKMRSVYDFILLDTPPVILTADASVVVAYADTAILVIKEDFVSVQSVREAMETLTSANPNVLGCILNQCRQPNRISLYYGYHASRYGYGYGYGYHYGSGYGNKSK